MRDSDVLEKNPYISRSALEALHEEVFSWALSRCGYDRTIAEDLVQQTYVELLTGKARFQQRSSLKTFVFSVVQNLSRSRYRRLASRLRLVNAMAVEVEPATAAAVDIDASRSLWTAVQNLPQRQRDIVELVFCRDMTIEAAAAVMGVTKGTGRVHYDRAKKALRKTMDQSGDWLDEA
tara:strand:- start:5467 stop:6000 length:534 start_codon:yes stop_codon:yes gene_type:complete